MRQLLSLIIVATSLLSTPLIGLAQGVSSATEQDSTMITPRKIGELPHGNAIKRQQERLAKEQEKLEYMKLKQQRKLKENGLDTLGRPIDENDEYYRNFMFLKLNRNQGYKNKQAFEDQKNYALLEKGVSYISFNLNFSSYDADDLWFEPLAIIDEVYTRSFGTQVSAGYFIRNNMAIGAKFNYNFSDIRFAVEADILDILIGASTYETNNATTYFAGSFLVKNFIPIGDAHRLFMVTETSVGYVKSHSLSKNYYDGETEIHKVETDKDSFLLGLSPGLMYFMTKGFAFEFNLNPIVAYYTKTTKINNEVAEGGAESYGLSFKFMPFNIQFGFSYYFGLNYNKNREYINSLKPNSF